ncbi:hypothetical protein [Streptomyces canus]|uniref:hypothetical protein n=1 Tax=Streptomyces canus TaxID=58343 RepID=UPI0033B80ABE
MRIQPWVIVEPPNERGLRAITINEKTVGYAWSLRQLRKILKRLGYPEEMDLDDQVSVYWRGGGSGTWPDRAWRRRAKITLMMAGLLGCMALLVNVGMPDAFRALTFAQRITGCLFILSGVIQGVAAFVTLDYWGIRRLRFSGAFVTLGVMIGITTNSFFLFMWFQEREYTRYVIAFIALEVWALWALLVVVHEKPWTGIPHPKKFAAGVFATALIATVNFAYSAMYQPSSVPTLLEMEVKFGKSQRDPSAPFIHLPVKFHVKNVGAVGVYFIGTDYEVLGRSAEYSSTTAKEMKDWRKAAEAGEDYDIYAPHAKYVTIKTGQIWEQGYWLDAGEQANWEYMVELPKYASYDAVAAAMSVNLMRRDRGRIDTDEFSTPHFSWDKEDRYYCPSKGCGEYILYRGRVQHNNNVINVTRKPRYVAATWSWDSTDYFISSYNFGRKEDFDEGETSRERDRYGLISLSANAMVPFAALSKI